MEIKKILKTLKIYESTISVVLGALIIIVTGILIINYFEGKRGQTISTVETEEKINLPKIHKIEAGEDLWKIAEKYYGSGYNWVDIAKENNINDPNQIKEGQEIYIPNVQPRVAGNTLSVTPEPSINISALNLDIEKKATQTTNIHKVEKGENLWKIAEKYYGSGYNWVDIANENKIKYPNIIITGQELIIPKAEPRLSTTEKTLKNLEPITGSTYSVVKGDSLWVISVRAYGDGYKWLGLAKANKLTNPNLIHPGNTLIIPR